MNRTEIMALIREIARSPRSFDLLEDALGTLSRAELSEQLLDCGIIPEQFVHDSSEEKLWAKYCDILFAHWLNAVGVQAEVIRMRGNAADVLGHAVDYSIVGDAKAFRLSRTAKNQKDFKITALDAWRRENTFACLICPLYQYPTRKSQVYEQAKARKVTLLSYVHLKFLLDYPPTQSLSTLWKGVGDLEPSPEAAVYWQMVDNTITRLANQPYDNLRLYENQEKRRTVEIGHESIAYYETLIHNYQTLSREEAITRLIKAEKLETRIEIIRRTISQETIV